MMFARVLRLILNTGFVPRDARGAEEMQEDVLHQLGTLERFRTPPWKDGLIDPAKRFVQSSAWSLIWARMQHDYGYHTLTQEQLGELNQALFEHFQPIEEENHE